jgi:hypothetical protein
LKKYTERRVEERRHTEISDTNKVDTSRWMPLPRNVPRGHQSGAKRPSRDERQESIDETTTVGERQSPAPAENRSPRNEHEVAARSHLTGRSQSTDGTTPKSVEKRSITEQRRHTDCSDPRTIATRLTAHIFHIRKRETP